MIRVLITLIFLILYFIISVPIMLVELVIQQFNMNLRNTTSLAWVQFGLKAVCLITGSRLTVNGYENVPKNKSVLFIGNHTSIFDIIFTYPLMKGPTGYISKKEIRGIPFLIHSSEILPIASNCSPWKSPRVIAPIETASAPIRIASSTVPNTVSFVGATGE